MRVRRKEEAALICVGSEEELVLSTPADVSAYLQLLACLRAKKSVLDIGVAAE